MNTDKIYNNNESAKLVSAIESGNFHLFMEALNNDANPNYDPLGSKNSPLLMALSYNRENFGLELLKNNADINAKNSLGRTPLHISASQRMEAFVEEILKNPSLKKNVYDNKGASPLDFALHSGCEKVVKMLENSLIKTTNMNDGSGKSKAEDPVVATPTRKKIVFGKK